jgi:putative ABC transport system substrate-binding protein
MRKTGQQAAGLRLRVGADTPCRSTRRSLLVAAAAWPLIAIVETVRAQSKQAPFVIGWLNFGSRELDVQLLAAFKEGLAALGWKEGSQIVIEERWAGGRIERLPLLAQELAAKNPAVIVAAPTQSLAAAAKAAPKTPIVQVSASDPVLTGFAASLARPGGMVTGLSNIVTDVTEKLLELLLAAAPKLKRVGFLADSTNFARVKLMDGARRSVEQRAIEARFEEVGKPEEIEPALTRLAKERVQGLVIMPSPLFTTERRRIARFTLEHRWPAISFRREFTEDGVLLSYGIETLSHYRRAAYYVDRILKGAKPGDLPVEQPTKLELVINAKTAKLLGLDITNEILLRADKVIE